LRDSRSLLRLGLAAAATSLIAGCSAASSSSATSAPAATTPAATTPASSATTLSGSQLAGILLPASSMPAGFKADSSATRDTGSQSPSDSPSPIAVGQICQTFAQTAYIRAAGISTSDFAQSDYVNSNSSEEVAEEIDVFTGTDAQKAMTTLWQEFGQCASFHYQSSGSTVSNTLTRSQVPGEGDEAIKAVIVSPQYNGGETIVAVRIGSQVITTLYSSSGKDLGSKAVDYASQITQRLQAAQ
jgi:hypothetical protein